MKEKQEFKNDVSNKWLEELKKGLDSMQLWYLEACISEARFEGKMEGIETMAKALTKKTRRVKCLNY